MRRIRAIHMIGIGGAGMSGIAEVLLNLGYVVSGSDVRESKAIERLRKLGAQIEIGHRAEYVAGVDVVVPPALCARKTRNYRQRVRRGFQWCRAPKCWLS